MRKKRKRQRAISGLNLRWARDFEPRGQALMYKAVRGFHTRKTYLPFGTSGIYLF